MEIIDQKQCTFTANTDVVWVRSSANGHLYRVTVTRPLVPNENTQKVRGLIVVDGDHMAGLLVSSVNIMAMAGEVPPTVVVSVGYPLDTEIPWMVQRGRDLTPTRFLPYERFTEKTQGDAGPASGGQVHSWNF